MNTNKATKTRFSVGSNRKEIKYTRNEYFLDQLCSHQHTKPGINYVVTNIQNLKNQRSLMKWSSPVSSSSPSAYCSACILNRSEKVTCPCIIYCINVADKPSPLLIRLASSSLAPSTALTSSSVRSVCGRIRTDSRAYRIRASLCRLSRLLLIFELD